MASTLVPSAREAQLHVAAADTFGPCDGVTGEEKDRRRVAGSEGSGPLECADHVEARTARGEMRVDLEGFAGTSLPDLIGQAITEKSAKLAEPIRRDGEPGRHGVASAFLQHARRDRRANRGAEIDAFDGAAGPRPGPARQRDGEGRAAEPVLDPRGEEADQPGMPAGIVEDESRDVRIGSDLPLGLGQGCRQHFRLQGLTLGVEPVELPGIGERAGRIVGREEQAAELRPPDAPARVDARSEHEAEMIGSQRPADAPGVLQCGEARIAPLAHDLEALDDEGAIEPDERHHVADRRQGDEVEPFEERRLADASWRVCTKEPADGDEGQEDDARRTEVPLPAGAVLAVRVDQRRDPWKRIAGLVMVEDDDIQAYRLGVGQRLVPGRPAVDGDEEARTAIVQGRDRLGIRPVAFRDPVGDMHGRIEAIVAHVSRDKRRRCRAVDIVVAEDRDGLLRADGRRDALGGDVHVAQETGIRHEAAQGRIEIGGDVRLLDAAHGQQPRDGLRQAVPLRDALPSANLRRRCGIDPGPAAERAGDDRRRSYRVGSG